MTDRKISLSTCFLQERFGDKRALEIAADAGFDGVDFSTANYGKDPYWHHWNLLPKDFDDIFAAPEEQFEEYFTRLGEMAKSLGLSVFQTHGRGSGYGGNEEFDKICKADGEKDLLAARYLGSPYCVIHSVTTILMGYDTLPEKMRELNYKMYKDLEPMIDKTGVLVSLETFGNARIGNKNGLDFFAQPDEFYNCYKSLPEGKYVICLDSGHSNVASVSFGCPPPEELVKIYGSDIKLLHLHDNRGVNDEHHFPFTGNVNWKALIEALENTGYKGVYNFEVNPNKFGEDIVCDSVAFLAKVAKQLVG